MLGELHIQRDLPGLHTLDIEGLPRIWVATLGRGTMYFTCDRQEALRKQQALWRMDMNLYGRECTGKRYARESLAIITRALEEE